METMNTKDGITMTFPSDLTLTTTLGKRAGEPTSISVRVAELPANVLERVLAYGFQRFINDPIGGADTPIADKVKAAKDMIERMKRGEVGRVRGEAVDPFMTIVMRVVRQAVKAKNADNYKKIMTGDTPDKVFTAILEKHRAGDTPQYKAIMAKATLIRKQQEELRDKPVSVDVDTSDL